MQTQQQLKQAQQDFPNLVPDDALQQEANMAPGREAAVGEGMPARFAVDRRSLITSRPLQKSSVST